MGNSHAWPVLRTTDISEAIGLAHRLLSVASRYDPASCYLHAWARARSVLDQWTAAFPDARTDPFGRDGSPFPVSASVGLTSFEEAAEALRRGMSITRCYVLWHDIDWPAVPELGLVQRNKYAEVQIAAHSDTIHCEDYTEHHTVFVHVAPDEARRAEWVAAQADAEIVGPYEFGW